MIRAAASSSASGRPSRRVQISATALALSADNLNSGWPACARCTNNAMLGDCDKTSSDGWVGNASGDNGNSCSPRKRRDSRLVISIRSPAQSDSSSLNNGAAETICSKLSSTSKVCLLRRKSLTLSSNNLLGDSVTPRICAIVGIIRVGSLIGAREMKKMPSANSWVDPPERVALSSWATCKARLVLPTPPGPVNVTRRTSRIRRFFTAVISAWRPMNDVG